MITLKPEMWLSYAARDYLDTQLQPNWCGVEYGSGGSTLWLAQRVRHLYSIEYKANWHRLVQRELVRHQIKNVFLDLRTELRPYANAAKLIKEAPDFVFVDGKLRHRCMEIGAKLLKPGGLLILDNVNEKIYRKAVAVGESLGWPSETFGGVGFNPKKQIEQECGMTTFWFKPEE